MKQNRYKSKLEAQIARILKRRKVEFTYETSRIKYVAPPKYYLPDFVIVRPDGSTLYLEVKGYFDPAARVKMRLVVKQNPTLDIRMMFPQNNKLNKHSKMRYSDWCEKNGIKYCIKEIPASWLTSKD